MFNVGNNSVWTNILGIMGRGVNEFFNKKPPQKGGGGLPVF